MLLHTIPLLAVLLIPLQLPMFLCKGCCWCCCNGTTIPCYLL